jgi:hypothetical protein
VTFRDIQHKPVTDKIRLWLHAALEIGQTNPTVACCFGLVQLTVGRTQT